MTEHHDPGQADRPSSGHSPQRSTSWWSVLAPAAALLVGLLIGGVVVGVADDEGVSAEPQPTSSPTAGEAGGDPADDPADDTDPTEAPTAGDTVVVVPDECLAAVDTVEGVTDLVRQGVGAIRDFQPRELRMLLRELEELDQRAREQAQACRDVQVDESPSQQ